MTPEIKALGNMLTATDADDTPRLLAISKRAAEIADENPPEVQFEGSPKVTSCCGASPIGASEDIGMCPDCKEHCEYEEAEP